MTTDNPGLVVTETEFRILYPNLFEARAFIKDGKPQGEPKFGLVMLFPPDGIEDLKAAAKTVAHAKWPGRDLKELSFPFKSGDAQAAKREAAGKDGSFYKGVVVVKASSKFQPGVADGNKKEILDPKRVYSGAYGYAELNFVAGNGVAGGRDYVTAYVNHLMVSRKGDRIATRTAEDVFSGIEGTSTHNDVGVNVSELDDEIPF